MTDTGRVALSSFGRSFVALMATVAVATAGLLTDVGIAAASQSAANPAITTGDVTTLAGSGSNATVDGTGSSASFKYMGGVAVVSGDAFVGTAGAIRQVDLSSGAVTTLAGSASSTGCTDSATASSVRFGTITDVATDGSYLYSADASCAWLRKTDLSTGATSTLATFGSGISHVVYAPDGYLYATALWWVYRIDPSTGSKTTFATDANLLSAIAADATYLYVTSVAGTIERITLSGASFSTVASDGPSADALVSVGSYLYAPSGGGGTALWRYAKGSGDRIVVAGTNASAWVDATGTDAWFGSITAIASDGTNLWVADSGNFRLRKVTSTSALPSTFPSSNDTTVTESPGRVSTFAGDGTAANTNGTGTAASFDAPSGVVVVGGVAYVAARTAIRAVDLSSGAVSIFAGSASTVLCVDATSGTAARFGRATDLATDGYYLYTVDWCGPLSYIRRISLANGATSTVRIDTYAQRLTVGPDGAIYYTETAFGQAALQRLDAVSGTITNVVTYGQINGYGSAAYGVTADSNAVYVAVSTGGLARIEKITVPGFTRTTVVQGTVTDEPGLFALTSAGNYLYGSVSNNGGATIGLRRYTKATGDWVNIAGSSSLGYANGTGVDARFNNPTDLTSDGTNLFVADTDNNRLRKVVGVKGPTASGGATRAGESLGGGSPAQKPTQACACDPVSTDTGNFYESYTDLAIPGRGPALNLSRTYNSLWAAHDGRFGFGWADSYNLTLVDDPYTADTKDVVQENGAQVAFHWNGASYDTASRVFATLVHNGGGTYTFTRNQREVFTFSSAGKLTTIADLNGETTTLSYSSNRLATVTDPGGRTLTFSYNLAGRVDSVTDSASRTVSYGYDGDGNLTSVTDVESGVTGFAYDADHLLTVVTDPRSHDVTTNVYDDTRRVISQTDALSHTSTIDYAPDDTGAIVTDPNGNVTVDVYSDGLLTSRTRGYGTADVTTTSYTYDSVTNGVATMTDGRGHDTTSTYDSNGNVLTVTDPESHTTTFTYDGLNDVLTATDGLSHTTTYTYDGNGNRLTESRPLNGMTNRTVTWHHADMSHPGDVTSITDPRGKSTAFTYDSVGNLTDVTDPNGDVTTYDYDSAGRRTSMVAPNGNVGGATPSQWETDYTYNGFGDLLTTTDPLGHVASSDYDADRNKISDTDAETNETDYTYDDANRLTTITRADTTSLANSYDDANNLIGQTDGASQTTSYTYDALSRVATTTDPLTHTTSYGYDENSNRITLTDPDGNVTTYSYDDANRLTGIDYDDGTTPDVTYSYDAANRRSQMDDGTGTTTYSYDNLDRLTSSTNGNGATVGYSYDLAGNLTGLTYPDTNAISRTFDDGGRLVQIDDWRSNTSTFSYDHNGNLTGRSLGNGTASTYTYNKADQNTAISHANGGGTFASFTYTRDDNAQLTGVTQTGAPGSSSESYAYNPLNQLATVAGNTATYDAADNPTLLANGTHQAFNAGNQLCWSAPTSGSCGSPPGTATTYTYDNRGNRTSKTPPSTGTTTYGYDQANRLITAGANATYTYDGDGLRASKTVSSTTTQFTWDTHGALPLMVTDGTSDYIYGPDGDVLEQIAGTTESWYHADQLGSTRAQTDAGGAVSGTVTYDSDGSQAGTTGSVATPFRWTGEYRDAETGFVYLRARYYDSTTSQFLNRDPVGAVTRSAYRYAGNDPLDNTDPTGLKECSAWSTLNPFSKKNCLRTAAEDGSGVSTVIEKADPAYYMISGYANEWDAAQRGCPGWTVFKYGAEGVIGAVATVGVAAGAVHLLSGLAEVSELVEERLLGEGGEDLGWASDPESPGGPAGSGPSGPAGVGPRGPAGSAPGGAGPRPSGPSSPRPMNPWPPEPPF